MDNDFSRLDDVDRNDIANWVDTAFEATNRVEVRLKDTLKAHFPLVHILLGMIPNATRRIITEVKSQTARDHCAMFHASRIFCNALGAFLLLQKGMLIEATTLVRSVLETTAQAILFMRSQECAERWLNGKSYKPAEVRKKLNHRPDIAPLYDALSGIAHPNPEARWMHSVDMGKAGYAIWYSGAYEPKRAAMLLATFIDIIVLYLDAFYTCYAGRLSVHAWPLMIEFGRRVNEDLRRWIDTLPDDSEAMRAFLADATPPPPMPPMPIEKATIDEMIAKMQNGRKDR